jgi:LPXTG-motif cell wall-anchored protein
MTSVIYAPPTPSPGGTAGSPSPTVTTTMTPAGQLPKTGTSGDVWGVLGIGLVLLLVGLAILLVVRHRRERTA